MQGITTRRDLEARALEKLPSSTPADRVAAKLAQERKKLDQRFKSFDNLLNSDEFEAFLHDRDWMLVQCRGAYIKGGGEMEQAALGAMMLCNESATHGMRRLHRACFKVLSHATIFSAICTLVNRRDLGLEPGLRTIDIVVVAERLRIMEQLERVGGTQYLSACVEACPSESNIDYYCNRVVEMSRLRHLNLLGHELLGLTLQPGADAHRLAAFARLANYQIQRKGWCDFKTLLKQVDKKFRIKQ